MKMLIAVVILLAPTVLGQENGTRALLARAEKGDPDAQFRLGLIYHDGQEEAQDYIVAVRWFRLAADHGYTAAQYNLGLMYADGSGVAKDPVLAHMWFNLAALRADDDDRKQFAQARDWIARQMSPQQVAEAQRRARDWKCCTLALGQSSGVATLHEVRSVYVDYLGSEEGSEWIREKIVNRILKSGTLTLGEVRESADAVLTGIGQVHQGPNGGYDATLVVRLVGKNNQVLWVGEAKPKRYFSTSVSSDVANKVVNDLLKAIEKDAKTKR